MRIHFWVEAIRRAIPFVGILFVAIALVATAIVYQKLPDTIPIHWDVHGNADSYGPRWTVFILPAVMALLLFFFAALPWLSPRNFEVDSFRSTYLYLMLVLVGLVGYLQVFVLWTTQSGRLNTDKALVGGVCVMVALLGGALGKVRRNFYLGIRTPWTIANEHVWIATHRLAGKLFVAAGVLGLVLLFFRVPNWSVCIPIFAAAAIAAVYSLVFYKALEHRQ